MKLTIVVIVKAFNSQQIDSLTFWAFYFADPKKVLKGILISAILRQWFQRSWITTLKECSTEIGSHNQIRIHLVLGCDCSEIEVNNGKLDRLNQHISIWWFDFYSNHIKLEGFTGHRQGKISVISRVAVNCCLRFCSDPGQIYWNSDIVLVRRRSKQRNCTSVSCILIIKSEVLESLTRLRWDSYLSGGV